ncbi:MAG: hypothetical protein PUB55_00705 [Bacteroidales bacterium]|nr:hypothetical protein [Bacteroidales bacterium]
MSVTSWQTDQIVWWKGEAIDRQSEGISNSFAVPIRQCLNKTSGFALL